MSAPKLLDLFCGAGGAAMGYHRAGFDVVGVDINPQKNYPFEFHQADAMTFPLDGYDVIHASPPCQRYSVASKRWNGRANNHPDLIDAVRDRLAGYEYVIENVVGAPVRPDLMLCGSMFHLGVRRHRLFESSADFHHRPVCDHASQPRRYHIYDHGRWYLSSVAHVYGHGGGKSKGDWREAMQIGWMTSRELSQAIPPAYTQWIGQQLLAAMERAA